MGWSQENFGVSKYIISILYIFLAHGLCYTNPAYPKEHMDTIRPTCVEYEYAV